MRGNPSFLRNVAAIYSLQFVENAFMADGDTEPQVWTSEKIQKLTQRHYDSEAQCRNREWYKSKKSVSLASIEWKWQGQADLLRLRIEIRCLHCDVQKKKKKNPIKNSSLNKDWWKCKYSFPSIAIYCPFRYLYTYFQEIASRKKTAWKL